MGLDPTDSNGDRATTRCFSIVLEGRLHPEAWITWPPVVFVGGPQLNYVALPLEVMSRATVSPVGVKVLHSLIKLQQYDGTGSLDTILVKFQRMASYLWWDEEDMFHHLCASLEEAVRQILWDISPHATVTDIIRLLQTRFGAQFQAERFKAELRARRRARSLSINSTKIWYNLSIPIC